MIDKQEEQYIIDRLIELYKIADSLKKEIDNLGFFIGNMDYEKQKKKELAGGYTKLL